MQTKVTITIAKPCDKDWNAMIPMTSGRFCRSCCKSVVDFTAMKPSEIDAYFLALNGKSICGRFKTVRPGVLTIKITNRRLTSPKQFGQLFFTALFICMGTTLFSCTDADGNMQKIEAIEIEDENVMRVTMGAPMVRTESIQQQFPRKAEPALENSDQDYPVKSNGVTVFKITKDSLVQD